MLCTLPYLTLPCLVGENLEKLGVEILNDGITGQCHRDHKL